MRRIVLGMMLMGCVFGKEILDEEKTSRFLEAVALVEPGGWDTAVQQLRSEFPEWVANTSVAEFLATLSPQILEGDQMHLIALLQRAIANCSELSGEKTAPFVYHYKNYQSPLFLIPKTDLVLDVKNDKVVVTSTLLVERASENSSLALHGKGHRVLSVSINGSNLSREQYCVTPNELVLLKVPQEERFIVEVKSEIDPYHNATLQGLYQTGNFLITQCESESARQIFYTLDRPDVLSRITTMLIADPAIYPIRISNGNLVEEVSLADGRKKIVWDDPIPKPSYLFACALGDFEKISGVYITKSQKKVDLEVYVEKTKGERALYSLEALKKAMEFDETFFDREYDLTSLKMLAVPGFNMGAMENKGLLVFNERYLIVSKDSGTDADFRGVASVVAHEYFHNWSGDRVTVRNWFELALKEAFTDFRTMLFDEWLFGKAFIRPKDVAELRARQFPEERSELGHPIMVRSYVSPSEIYDATTYTKGREVFRTLQTYLDLLVPDGFRKTQNLYFERYDGQAVTFRELLKSADEVLKDAGKTGLGSFERWFLQQGTPVISIRLESDPESKKAWMLVTQSCPHPRTGETQKPLLIPFTYELFRPDGSIAVDKQMVVLAEDRHEILIPVEKDLIPVFLHDYGAPVILDYPYTLDELAFLMQSGRDPFTIWEAGQNFTLRAMREADFSQVASRIKEVLENDSLPLLAKAQLLSFPSLRMISESWQDFDFPKLQKIKERYMQEIAFACSPILQKLLSEHEAPAIYAPTTQQMEIREFRGACLNLLARILPTYRAAVYQNYLQAGDFDTSLQSLQILAERPEKFTKKTLDSFHEKWKADTAAFCYWLSVQARSCSAAVEDIKQIMKAEGFDPKNPNHIRASVQTFVQNLARFHDPAGEGYRFAVDQIIEIAKYNPSVSFNLAKQVFLDFHQLPDAQKKLLKAESQRLLSSDLPPEVYELLTRVAGI